MEIVVDVSKLRTNRLPANMTDAERGWIRLGLIDSLIESSDLTIEMDEAERLPVKFMEYVRLTKAEWTAERDRLLAGMPKQ